MVRDNAEKRLCYFVEGFCVRKAVYIFLTKRNVVIRFKVWVYTPAISAWSAIPIRLPVSDLAVVIEVGVNIHIVPILYPRLRACFHL